MPGSREVSFAAWCKPEDTHQVQENKMQSSGFHLENLKYQARAQNYAVAVSYQFRKLGSLEDTDEHCIGWV